MTGKPLFFLNNQGLDQKGGGVTILRHLVDHFKEHRDVTVLAESKAAMIPRVRQVVLPEPKAPRGPLWRFAPYLRARHWRVHVRAHIPEDAVVIALDCHFALALLQHSKARRVYLSLSAIPRQEQAQGATALRTWQYVRLERSMIQNSALNVVASETHAREIRTSERLASFDPLILPPLFCRDRRAVTRPARAVTRAPVDAVTILSVARLIPLKNLHLIPDLAHHLQAENCHFVILGDGPERSTIERRARELGVQDRIEIHGDSAHPEDHYARADLMFHPSRYESFGMAVFEAMLQGVPIVCAGPSPAVCVGIHEFVEDGVHGTYVDITSLAAMADALRPLIRNEERRRELGTAARERALHMLAAPAYETRFEQALDTALT